MPETNAAADDVPALHTADGDTAADEAPAQINKAGDGAMPAQNAAAHHCARQKEMQWWAVRLMDDGCAVTWRGRCRPEAKSITYDAELLPGSTAWTDIRDEDGDVVTIPYRPRPPRVPVIRTLQLATKDAIPPAEFARHATPPPRAPKTRAPKAVAPKRQAHRPAQDSLPTSHLQYPHQPPPERERDDGPPVLADPALLPGPAPIVELVAEALQHVGIAGADADDADDDGDGTVAETQAIDPDDEAADFADLVGSWTADDVEAIDPTAAFRRGSGPPPPAAALRGHHLLRLLELPEPSVPALAANGLASSTSREHRRMLKRLALLPADLHQAPLPVALSEWINRRRKAAPWRWATALKNAAVVQGALALLPLYRETMHPVLLAPQPIWRQSMRTLATKTKRELPQQPKACCKELALRAIAKLQARPELAACLALTWASCQRSGCILKVRISECVLDHTTRTASVKMVRGKVSASRGPYTVHTPQMPPELWNAVAKYFANMPASTSGDPPLFPKITGVMVKEALREVDPLLEQRSLRRGSLQHMATLPNMTNEWLRTLSGHTNDSTLFRYLNWGVAASHVKSTLAQFRA